jgi:hypothetical protein
MNSELHENSTTGLFADVLWQKDWRLNVVGKQHFLLLKGI